VNIGTRLDTHRDRHQKTAESIYINMLVHREEYRDTDKAYKYTYSTDTGIGCWPHLVTFLHKTEHRI
jgi:hypothetical protein